MSVTVSSATIVIFGAATNTVSAQNLIPLQAAAPAPVTYPTFTAERLRIRAARHASAVEQLNRKVETKPKRGERP